MHALLCLFLIAGTAVAQEGEVEVQISLEPAHYAWWLRVTFTPTHTQIRGIPVKELNQSWRRASELKKEYLPKHLLYEGGSDLMDQSGIAFSVAGDFNNDGSADEVLVGVYETDSGKRGSFLLILSRSTSGRWQKTFLEEDPGGAGFSGVSWDQERLWWLHCMMCDVNRYLIWDQQRRAYVWVPVKHGPE